MAGSSPPRVFVSYAHESDEHKNRAIQLCGQLRQSGLDSWMDAYEDFPPQGWPQWMLYQIRQASCVLIVCSEGLLRRFEGGEAKGKGKGAKWEGAIVTQAIYDAENDNRKFVPVVVDANDKQHIPTILRPFTCFDVSEQLGRESLYRLLTDQPLVIPPPIGSRHSLVQKHSGSTGPFMGGGPRGHTRIQAEISFASSSTGWALLLKVVNVSEIPLYLKSPRLVFALKVDRDTESPADCREESFATEFVPTGPVDGPLLPTQERVYFLSPDAMAFARSHKRFAKASPSVRISTAVGEELRLDDDETSEKIHSLLGIPTKEGRHRQFDVRMPHVMSLLHKRCSDQPHTGFKVYPPQI